MTNCPICEGSIQKNDLECSACGEGLSAWRAMSKNGEVLRQRGLVSAARHDYRGALIAFMQASLTNPFDDKSMFDVARSLIHMEAYEHADRMLAIIGSRPGCKETADALRRAIGDRATRRIAPPTKPTTKPPVKPAPTAAPAPTPKPAPIPEAIQVPPEPLPLPPEKTQPAPQKAAPLPEREEPPQRRPLLAMGVVTGRQSWFRKPPKSPWTKILDRERVPGVDWTATPPAVAEVVHLLSDANERGALQYALGLGYWQSGNRPAAEAAFRACIENQPKVINPHAYLICLHLDGEQERVRHILEKLEKLLGKDHLLEVIGFLEDSLREADPSLYKAIRNVRENRPKR